MDFSVLDGSSLSEKVKKLILFEEPKHIPKTPLDEDFLLDLSKFKKQDLTQDFKSEDEQLISSAEYIRPYLVSIHLFFSKLSLEEFEKLYGNYFAIFKDQDLFKKAFLLKQRPILSYSLLVCTLEHCLGDILAQNKLRVPMKLSEILSVKNFNNILGDDILHLLKVFIGPLNGINIRNILLHGFISPKEFHPSYLSFLFLLIFTISKKVGELTHRDITDVCEYQINDKLDIITSQVDPKYFEDSYFVSTDREECWSLCISDYIKGDYVSCLMVLFPLIEHGVRRVYVISNKTPLRLLTAESDELYTTIDILLRIEKSNEVFLALGDEAANALYDIFIWNEGFRLRDYLCHGNINHKAITKSQCEMILLIGLGLCAKYLSKDVKEVHELFEKGKEILKNYQPLYHPRNLLEREIKKLDTPITSFTQLLNQITLESLEIKDVDQIHYDALEKDLDELLKLFPFKKLEKEKCYNVNEDHTRHVTLIKAIIHCKEIMGMLEKEYQELTKLMNDRSGWKRHRKYYILLKLNMQLFFKIIQFLINLSIYSIEKDVSLHIWEITGAIHAAVQRNEFKRSFDIIAAMIGCKSHKVETLSTKLSSKYQSSFEELKKKLSSL